MMFEALLLICMAGSWDSCSGGLKEIRISNLPTIEVCEEALDKIKLNSKVPIKLSVCIKIK